MYLGKADVNTYDKGAAREFLVSSGAGNYGSSTVIGANTRSGHGLLVARAGSLETHAVLISKLEETLYAHNKKYQLSTNRYKDLIYPDGFRYLQEYQGVPHPSMLFVIHSIFLEKSIFMPRNGTCTIVRYKLLESPYEINMDIRPLFAHRPKDGPCSDQSGANFTSSDAGGGVISVSGRGLASHISFAGRPNSALWSEKPLWFENLIYERDALPGKTAIDSLWSPGYGSIAMKRGDSLYAVLSEAPESYSADELESLIRDEALELGKLFAGASRGLNNSIAQNLALSSYSLVADSGGASPAIFSGFPSAELRARDAFIALPGVTLATGRANIAKRILESWLDRAADCNAIMPSHIGPEGESVLGDIDSGLWFVHAMSKYTACEGPDFARSRLGELSALIEKYMEGCPELGAVMDDGTKLLKYFNIGHTRNWMSGDADGEPLVERKGYLVDVNALWFNALRFMEETSRGAGDGGMSKRYRDIADAAYESFARTFWNEGARYLYDWVDPSDGSSDGSIRPNAIFSISLHHPALPEDMGRAVFETCWNELYTTYGLRTLDPRHEKFKGRAEGRPDQKKKARLRGMAWPWLLAHFITSYMRYNPDGAEMGWRFIRPFASHLRRGCLWGVAEYFDGVMPYEPNGDILSAISIGELLRVIHEELIESNQ
ncbi:MAG: amylo-alpha-1,6-glucosidase [Synergistaceae bacterium]|nr:amylo-alpha-1,6-glucosidase [Synergistaceae bacterium]